MTEALEDLSGIDTTAQKSRETSEGVPWNEMDNLGIRLWLNGQDFTNGGVERVLGSLNAQAQAGRSEAERELARRRRHALVVEMIRRRPGSMTRRDELAAENRRRGVEKARWPWADHWRSY
ncbi:MAG: hypothetical protein QXQ87_04590 [Halobacteria archaeon]